jgi:hypothetical protein
MLKAVPYNFLSVALAVTILVDPVPCAQTPARRTRRQSTGDLVLCLAGPYARVVDRDDCHVPRLERGDIRSVRDGNGGASKVLRVGLFPKLVVHMERPDGLGMS